MPLLFTSDCFSFLSLPSTLFLILSLPPYYNRYLQKLPQDLLNAMELGHLAGFSPNHTSYPHPTPLQELTEHIVTLLHSNNHLTADMKLKVIAKELVNFSLTSACAKLGLGAGSLPFSRDRTAQPDSFSQLRDPRLRLEEMDQEGGQTFLDYRPGKRWSMASGGSVDSMEQEEGLRLVVTDMGGRRPSRKVSLQVESHVIEEEEVGWEEGRRRKEQEEEELEDALRMAAKKLVKKALHLACKKWESMNRRSSIDYLIASTKRLKIASPSPPPTLHEEDASFEAGIPSLQPTVELVERGGGLSPIPDRGRGKKRNRSQSHDIMMMKELEHFREVQLGLDGQEDGEREFAKPRRVSSRGKDGISVHRGGSPYLHPPEMVGELISDIRRMSIVEMQSESGAEDGYTSDEEYTILSAITKPAGSTSDSDTQSPVPPPNSPTTLQVTRDGSRYSPSPLLQQTFPSAIPPSPGDIALRLVPQFVNGSSQEEMGTCTSPEFQQQLNTSNAYTERETYANAAVELGFDKSAFLTRGPIHTTDHPVPEMDYFVILHTRPPPGLCQKFLCSNMDEVNLMYHCWLYPDAPFDPAFVRSQMLPMGVFLPQGVAPVHQDLQDAGVAFHYLHPRLAHLWPALALWYWHSWQLLACYILQLLLKAQPLSVT